MNNFQTIETEYLRASRTIETVIVSRNGSSKVFFIYNHEGNSFRVFQNLMSLANFFRDKAETDFHFNTELQLDYFLSEVKLSV